MWTNASGVFLYPSYACNTEITQTIVLIGDRSLIFTITSNCPGSCIFVKARFGGKHILARKCQNSHDTKPVPPS